MILAFHACAQLFAHTKARGVGPNTLPRPDRISTFSDVVRPACHFEQIVAPWTEELRIGRLRHTRPRFKGHLVLKRATDGRYMQRPDRRTSLPAFGWRFI